MNIEIRPAPGHWVVYGVEPVENARANLAQAQAQLKATEAEVSLAWQRLKQTPDAVSSARMQRGNLLRQHASQGALREADDAVKAAEAVRHTAQAGYDKVNDHQQALRAVQQEANHAADRAQHAVAAAVLTPGDLYHWDDFKVMSPLVLKDGKRYRMCYVGCHFIGEEYTCGLADRVPAPRAPSQRDVGGNAR